MQTDAPEPHPFDTAVALAPQADGSLAGRTSPAYWNMVGPFGGITAAQMMQAVVQHPACEGEPLALTVNYAAAVADGPLAITAQPARTNRSTQHWTLAMQQNHPQGGSQLVCTATAVTASRRTGFNAADEPMPAVPAPEAVPVVDRSHVGVAWLGRYEVRPVHGDIPVQWDDQGDHSLSQLWMRDWPPRALDHAAVAALADVFFPRIWLRRARRVPSATVSMTVYFHTSATQLAACGTEPVLGQARARAFAHGFFDQTGQLWSRQGLLLATTHQVVYFKD